MGLGDWIMATAQARAINLSTGRQVLVTDSRGRVYWSPVFDHNPRLLRQDAEGCAVLVSAPGARPYIAGKTTERWIWKEWDIAPGELYFQKGETDYADAFAGGILIEPHTKVVGGNKSWPFARWQAVVDAFPEVRFIQVGNAVTRKLSGVQFVETPTFRHAAAILAQSSAVLTTEGALHHAAAALDVPAIVLWSEFIDPKFTGYKGQINIRHAGKACGARVPCETCRESMNAITVDEVAGALRGLLYD